MVKRAAYIPENTVSSIEKLWHTMADEGSITAVVAGVDVLGVAVLTVVQGLVAGPTLQVGQPHSACPLPKHSIPFTRPDGTVITSCVVEHSGGGEKGCTVKDILYILRP